MFFPSEECLARNYVEIYNTVQNPMLKTCIQLRILRGFLTFYYFYTIFRNIYFYAVTPGNYNRSQSSSENYAFQFVSALHGKL